MFDDGQVRVARSLVADILHESAGLRDPFAAAPSLKQLVGVQALRTLVSSVLGDEARPIQALILDKTSEKNWPLPWHQDVTVPFAAREAVAGFGPWTLKRGVPHAAAPAWLLEGLLIARIHLDDSNLASGGLRCLRGSHRFGLIASSRTGDFVDSDAIVAFDARAGDVLLMRPLVLHSSGRSSVPAHRRVLQIEYAGGPAPPPLNWRPQV